ncbi:MAG: hypothetical protein F9K30_19925, partial [Dechloromonas sp.]
MSGLASFVTGAVGGYFQGKDWREGVEDRKRKRQMEDERFQWERSDQAYTEEERDWKREDRSHTVSERKREISRRDEEEAFFKSLVDGTEPPTATTGAPPAAARRPALRPGQLIEPENAHGALGASIGSWVGAMIFSSLPIPIPGLGAAIGSFLGTYAGTWIGNSYDDITATGAEVWGEVWTDQVTGRLMSGRIATDNGGDSYAFETIMGQQVGAFNTLLTSLNVKIDPLYSQPWLK